MACPLVDLHYQIPTPVVINNQFQQNMQSSTYFPNYRKIPMLQKYVVSKAIISGFTGLISFSIGLQLSVILLCIYANTKLI